MLKKTFAVALSLCLIIGLCGCGELQQNTPSSSEEDQSSQITSSAEKDDKEDEKDNNNKKDPLMTKDYTNPSIYTLDTLVSMGLESPRKSDKAIDKAADKMLKTIEARPDTLKPKAGGKYIYVATGGTDGKGYGYSTQKPVATIAYANLLAKSGDVVVLKRGNMWRENVVGKEGVSYGAYGKGNKPTIYGSKKNYADVKWSAEGENVYRVQTGTASDIGLIVFDHGKACGSKVWKKESLKRDYDFVCIGGYVYVYLTKGNPAELYSDIEICVTQHVVKLKSNSTIQNWRIMYGGAHGVGMVDANNVEFDGCVVGYIGGGLQGGAGLNTRYGNGIEIWGECDGYIIRNCHVYQCYDAGITMQYVGSKTEQNILFENNLLEYSVYNIEYFLSGGTFKNILIQNNIVRHGGYGWGYYSRPNKNRGTNVSGGCATYNENFVYKNNIFDHSKSFLLSINGSGGFYPTFKGNTFAQKGGFRICIWDGKNYGMKKHGEEALNNVFKDLTGKLITY